MKKLLLRSLCLMLTLVCVLSLAPSGRAEDRKVVRVGWYESAFHRTDDFGRKSGYGYEYQRRVAIYTGWVYEYVEGSWPELLEMLMAGDLDLLSDVSYTEARAEKLLYSAEAMGSENFHVFISPDNTEIRPEDFSSLNGKRVAVNKSSIQEQLFADWCAAHAVTAEIVETTDKTPVLLEKLMQGEFDALVTLDTYGNSSDMVPVWKVGFAESYFGINKARPDLKQDLDVAMNLILEENRDFNQELTERFNKSGSVNSFLTVDEKEWLADHGVIRVGYRDNFLPFCAQDPDAGALTGALADFLSFAETSEKNARLTFETRAFATTEEALKALTDGEIDCLFPVSFSTYDGEQLGVILTDALVKTEMFAMVRAADRQGVSAEQDITVAVIRGLPSYDAFLMDHYPGWKTAYFDDLTECFQAVARDEADCVLVSNYRINSVSDLASKYKLATQATGEVMNQSFALKDGSGILYAILNKVIRLMPDATMNTALASYSFVEEKVSLAQFLRDNLSIVIAAAAVVSSVILLLLLWNVKTSLKADKDQRLISETERDPLTQLYNRNFFIAYVNQKFRAHPEKPMDAVVVNVDRFHNLNSLHGREFGDKVLRALAAEITRFAEETEGIAGRVGGDHFDIYCPHREDHAAVLERFQEKIEEFSEQADIRLRMGVMPWQKETQPEQMFALAWSACSLARNDSAHRCLVYDEAMRQRDELGQRLQNDLARALENRELKVYYQPKYSIRADKPALSSAEALVRWKHPELGMIPPDDFIPLFEKNGQISDVDQFVWAEAARQIASWRERFGITLPVSVNLSRVDVFDPNLSATLDGLISQYNLNRSDLKLEVTESAYTDSAEQLIQVIQGLRKKGYEIEMDDFGSGYSSLNMISSMPIDALKMDIEFIRNIGRNERDFRMVEIVIEIAKFLGVPVIAEGVETERQLSLLKKAECDLVQGYYFSRPLAAEDFDQLLKKEQDQ